MAASVESLFYVGREIPWHGLGIQLEEAPTSEDAIVAAGLDWKVEKKPIFDATGKQIDSYFANTRDKDGSVLGIVSGRYEIVQNSEAFAFTDSLVDEGMVYETAGSLKDGKVVWLLGRLPRTTILGDDLEPYVTFTNSFDGSGAIQVCCCHTRVVCANTLNLALKEAKRKWSTRHIGDIQGKIHQAQVTLGLINDYTVALQQNAEILAAEKFSDSEVENMLDMMYPITEETSDRQKNSILRLKDNFFYCLGQDDIKKFRGTKYGVIMAATDFADHGEPARRTANFEGNRWYAIMQGHQFVDTVYKQLAA